MTRSGLNKHPTATTQRTRTRKLTPPGQTPERLHAPIVTLGYTITVGPTRMVAPMIHHPMR